MQLKNRKEMDAAYQWKLEDIYPSYEAWETALNSLQGRLGDFDAVQGTLGTAEGAKAALDLYYDITAQVEPVYLYAMLLKSGDNGDSEYQAMTERAMMLLVQLETVSSFLVPELAALPTETLEAYAADPALELYRHHIKDILRVRQYVLSPEQEKLLSMMSDAAQTPDNSFTMLESVDMTFPSILDEDGSEVQLTHGNFSVYRESGNRDVRRDSFEKYFGEFRRYINTFAALYGGSVKFDNFYADVRGHKSALSKALNGNNVPEEVYTSLIDAVHSALPAMGDYLALRKKVLGLDELHMYDLYCPMVEASQLTYTFEEAKQLVKEALRPLGEDYGKLLDKAFDEGWIDVYENRGKTTGAFSCGVYSAHPYVLLNYTNTLDDVFTLAHELGHAMHSYKSDKAQAYPNHNYSIMAAEVASTVNEVLLLKYLLSKETEEKNRAYLLNHFLEGFRTTLFRQTLFAEFEMETHAMAQSGQPLTAQSLNELYRRLNEEYYPGAFVDELQDIEWARIPHFYNAFYVYQYATGYSSAVTIAQSVLDGSGTEGYLKFLTTGGSDYPIEELKLAGIDLSKPEVVAKALSVFADSVNELSAILTK